MSAVATREASVAHPAARAVEPSADRLFEPKGPTLEDRIVAAWDELTASGRVSCPLCDSEMSRTRGCETCGSELA
jgi:hypothetical protein